MVLIVWLLPLLSNGQGRVIKGTVKDSSSLQVLSGVTISVKGHSNKGTLSGANGDFSIKVPEGTSLLDFSFTGYKDIVVQVSDTSTYVDIKMTNDVKSLSSLVITGYTQQSKLKTDGSLTTIPGTALQNVPLASFDVMLQGRVPGLYVGTPTGQPGEAGRVTLRGMGSINGDVQPLYLVDGVQVANTIFSGLNTDDFESVVVLKDAASTAQYGSRGANGVILITTKKGKGWDDGTVRVDF